jgi:hypothetical protein
MKRLFLMALTLGLAGAGTAWSQSNILPLPTIGVRGGFDFARETESPSHGTSMKNQTYGMAAINYEFNLDRITDQPESGLSLRSDLVYLRTGGKVTAGGITEKDRVDELRLAPFLVYRYAMGGIVPFAQAGPFVGYDVNNKFDRSGAGISQSGDIPNWRKGNFGLNAGLGFKVPTPGGAVNVDARYSWGLVNKYDGPGNLKRRTDGVLLLAGYDFRAPW